MFQFLKPLKLMQELSQNLSYSIELWYGSCFYDVYYDAAKKRQRNRRCRRFFLPFFAELYILESFEDILFFFKKITLTFALNTVVELVRRIFV